MEYHIAIEGTTEGPLTEDEVRSRLAAGALRPIDHCWSAGWAEWRPVRDVFPQAVADSVPAAVRGHTTSGHGSALVEPDRRRRMPVRRDRTSTPIFFAIVFFVVVAGVFGLIRLLSGGFAGRPAPSGPPKISRGRQVAERAAREAAGRDAVSQLTELQFSGSNLEQIAQACVAYARANNGELPTFCEDLRPLLGERFEAVMDVPETPVQESRGYVLRMGVTLTMPGDTPIAFETRPRADGSRAVAFLDGRVRVLRPGDPDLKRALSR